MRFEQCLPRSGSVYCYDIHERDRKFETNFDTILMFDVLEHIADEGRFLESPKFHLSSGGYLITNVPAHQWLYSPYDKIQGHCRRYSLRSFLSVAKQNGFEIVKASYWGAPLVPVAALRELSLSLQKTGATTYAKGFDPRSPRINRFLMRLSRLELLPPKWIGTSVMAVLRIK